MQFVDVTNDIAFRKIFGNENKKAALVSFLNAALDLKDSIVIVDVMINNWSKQELDEYNKVFIREQDERGRLELAESRGKVKEKYDVLDNGIEMGFSLEQLSKLTGLAKNEIEEYIKTKPN